jgi:hypothetical protein
MGDHELEEGEACDDPDSIYDPDTAFSYLVRESRDQSNIELFSSHQRIVMTFGAGLIS